MQKKDVNKPLFQLLLLNSEKQVEEFIISNGKGPKVFNPFIRLTDKNRDYFLKKTKGDQDGEV